MKVFKVFVQRLILGSTNSSKTSADCFFILKQYTKKMGMWDFSRQFNLHHSHMHSEASLTNNIAVLLFLVS